MDLHPLQANATAAEREAVDAVLGPDEAGNGHVARGGHEVRQRRPLLLPALHAVMDAVGWISEGALDHVSRRLAVPPAEAYGVASFYAMFALEPRPPHVAHVCDDIACKVAGADRLVEELEEAWGPPGTASADGTATWLRSPCLGQCERAPAVWLQRAGHADASVAPADRALVDAALATGDIPAVPPASASAPQVVGGREDLRVLRRVGVVDPTSLDDYRAHGGYEALRRALALGPAGVVREVAESKLMGRGGAAFPTGVKWEAVATAPARPHYLIANADESEPGTFKDRVLLEQDPFALVESMTVAGIATGCERGYLYLRGEYPLATARLRDAIDQARARGLLGPDVMGEGVAFDIELRRGAGAYICGEETALMESLEGRRGEPRNKPPFPTQVGLFGKPTVVNNVETLVNVLDVLAGGGPAFAARGTPGSTGTKLYCVSGSVGRPGVYEVPFGVTLRGLLDRAGGVTGTLAAVLLGGAAGTFLTPDELDIPLTFEGTRAVGAALGSGVVMAFDDTVDLRGIVTRIAGFFRDESCGQCVPCRVGTVRQEEALARLGAGGDGTAEVALLDELAQVMRDASICGLGHTAASAVQSAVRKGLFTQGKA